MFKFSTLRRLSPLLFCTLLVGPLFAQAQKQVVYDSLFLRKIYDLALENGEAYENLRSLCKDVGPRLTGSPEAEMAVIWGEEVLNRYGFDLVYKQAFKAPLWQRGSRESGWLIQEDSTPYKLKLLALGFSPPTKGTLDAEVIEVQDLDALKQLNEKEVEGKVVFINQAFDQKHIYTFEAYGGCFDMRWEGAGMAAQKGALACIIRSLAQQSDHHPHTGTLNQSSPELVPAAAISTRDADYLQSCLKKGKVRVRLDMDCGLKGETTSHNVIAELKGHSPSIISFGGHLDSWDVGEGAHDDGAGIVHCIEAMRILKALNYKPRHTLRCVLFMNEESGNFGGKKYAEQALALGEQHMAAIETDRGGFMPVGFDVRGNQKQLALLRSFSKALKPYRLFKFDFGYGGVDIGPLFDAYPKMLQLGMNVVSQQYFDYHHAETDVFEAVNRRELELGAAAMAAMVYMLDQNLP